MGILGYLFGKREQLIEPLPGDIWTVSSDINNEVVLVVIDEWSHGSIRGISYRQHGFPLGFATEYLNGDSIHPREGALLVRLGDPKVAHAIVSAWSKKRDEPYSLTISIPCKVETSP